MSLYDKASLIQVPSLYKDGLLVSTVPEDRSGDFTFTRGSNLSATRVGPNGYIEKGYENLLLQSNTFSDAAWSKNNTSVTNGQSGYDGSNDAWLLEANSSGSYRVLFQTFNKTGINSFSCYAKQGTTEWLMLRLNSNARVSFNLSNGTLGTQYSTIIKSTIEDVGGGWYRISITSAENITFCGINLSNADYTYVSDAGDSVYIQDAMLNQGLVAYPYIETTTAPVAGGILEDEPRIDFSDGCGHLLLEPSRTNLIDNSEYFIFQNGTEEYNSTISPEGVANATKIIEDSSLNGHRIFYNNIIPQNASAVNYTFSGFFKVNIDSPSVRNEIQIQFFADSVVYSSSSFNIASGTTTGSESTHRIDNYGNGWYRCSFTASVLQSTNTFSFARVNMGNGSSFFYQGDGVSSIFAYGLQLEQDATYPTSYIPTYGVSQTRLGDSMQSDTSSFGITNEFTLFIDVNAALVDGTSLNQMGELRWYTQATNRYRFYKSSNAIFISNNIQVDDRTKIALKITASECKTFVDGVLDSTISLPTSFASFDSISRNMETKVKEELKQIILFPTALSDDECIALTSL